MREGMPGEPGLRYASSLPAMRRNVRAPDVVALGHGHNGASFVGLIVIVADVLILDLMQGGENVPWVAVDSHGYVLSECGGKCDSRREIVRPDSDRGRLSRVVTVAPKMG